MLRRAQHGRKFLSLETKVVTTRAAVGFPANGK
jgi:hypothetical protein